MSSSDDHSYTLTSEIIDADQHKLKQKPIVTLFYIILFNHDSVYLMLLLFYSHNLEHVISNFVFTDLFPVNNC